MKDSLFSVENKVTLVSGASRGIGYELAHGFAMRGARVIITGRKMETLQDAAARIKESAGADVDTLVCDVSSVDEIRETVAAVRNKHGRIDTLLNVAGLTVRKPAEEYTPEEFDFVTNVDIRGAFFMAQEVGKVMIKQKSGTQVHVESYNTFSPLTRVMPYVISKFGMHGMIKALASEWGEYGIRVNGIGPGFILTDFNRSLWSQPVMKDWAMEHTPLRRFGEVEDMIGTVVFLASDASSFITGQTVYIDGGLSACTPWPIDKAST
ncbi:SDR family oxidoreductase [Marispirochaeta sp.]|jgi:gluconate 5-dehydrogenase|uniref:SDR family NAD(P)-dependent oxidoreductase n=1 Tax=Marispirochaeta sp. TaxID=2038653 RepID=UPI0029C87791|nr:SDR family oxidoreductase [Marispirochaeta sp.]